MDDITLIEQAKAGDKNALNKLLTQNYNILKGYVIKMTGDPNLAQDVVQDTMLKAVINIKKFIPNAKFSTWLITIATNVYRDFLRKHKETDLIDENIISKEPGPEISCIEKIEYEVIKQILLKLPYEKRAVFILKHYYGYKYEDIAGILGCPVGTVRSRLNHCIKYIVLEFEKRRML